MKREHVFSMVMEKDKKLPLYVVGIGCEEYQNHIIRKEGLPQYQLAICVNGSGRFLIDGNEYAIESGMVFYFRPDIPHEYYPVKEPWTTLWVLFSGFAADSLLNAVNFGPYEVFVSHNTEELVIWYNKLFHMVASRKLNYMLEASGILYNLLIHSGGKFLTQDIVKMSRIDEKLNKITTYIKENYQNNISLEELASTAGVSSSYLCRIFKQKYDITIFTYVLQYRIHMAKELIVNQPDQSIKSIAYECGFSDCSYFGAVFKELEGCSPNQFRILYTKNK